MPPAARTGAPPRGAPRSAAGLWRRHGPGPPRPLGAPPPPMTRHRRGFANGAGACRRRRAFRPAASAVHSAPNRHRGRPRLGSRPRRLGLAPAARPRRGGGADAAHKRGVGPFRWCWAAFAAPPPVDGRGGYAGAALSLPAPPPAHPRPAAAWAAARQAAAGAAVAPRPFLRGALTPTPRAAWPRWRRLRRRCRHRRS